VPSVLKAFAAERPRLNTEFTEEHRVAQRKAESPVRTNYIAEIFCRGLVRVILSYSRREDETRVKFKYSPERTT
jgi:hypothetical protein